MIPTYHGLGLFHSSLSFFAPHFSRYHDKLPNARHPITSQIYHVRPWLSDIVVWWHSGSKRLRSRSSRVACCVQEEHAMTHMQAVCYISAMVENHAGSGVAGRGGECDCELVMVLVWICGFVSRIVSYLASIGLQGFR